MPMPCAAASRAFFMRSGSPSSVSEPVSGRCVPASTRISVDLPAPFSPISPTTSFGLISMLMSFSACTPGKDLLMPVAASMAVT